MIFVIWGGWGEGGDDRGNPAACLRNALGYRSCSEKSPGHRSLLTRYHYMYLRNMYIEDMCMADMYMAHVYMGDMQIRS